MAIVTVVGSSGMTVQVTVEGAQMQTLASSYAHQIYSAATTGDLTSVNLVSGSNSAPSATTSVVQGVVTTGGVFNLTGNYTNLVVGALGGPLGDLLHPTTVNPVSPLDSAVTVDATGATSSNLSVLTSNLAGVTFRAGNQNGSFLATAGDNLFDASGKTGNWTVVGGDGNDTINASNGVNNIRTGGGNNLVNLATGTNFVGSEGQDTIDGVQGGTDTVTLLGGNSLVTLQNNAVVVDSALIGSQISVGATSTVFGGTNSTVTFTGDTGTIVGAVGDTISAAGDLQVDHGANQTISVSGALQFISGTGDTSISAGLATVWGASALNATVDTTGLALYTANQPSTTGAQSIDASSSHGTLEAWTGAGNQTVIGTSGSDHFVFGTAFEGSTGDSYATVTGGSGAANTFGVLSGHTGGDITITDFGSAAGNMFFMYNYKPADADQAVKNLLATATISGGNTTLQLDNNMKVTFLGVTDLKSSNIVIS